LGGWIVKGSGEEGDGEIEVQGYETTHHDEMTSQMIHNYNVAFATH
jgi:hypothetical protein